MDQPNHLLIKLRAWLQSPDVRQQYEPNHYMLKWFDQLELLDAIKDSDKSGRLVFRFPVVKEQLQAFGTYAGGAQAAAHDVCTAWTIAVISKPDYWSNFGATRTLNMSYFKPAKEGEFLRLETQIVSIGSRLAMIRGTLVREKDGEIVSTSEHHLYNSDAIAAKL